MPAGADASYFDVNDDGYVVPVGQGNSYTSGAGPDGTLGGKDDLWGTTVKVGENSYRWGIPVKFYDEENETDQVQIANALPDFSLGLNTTFRYKGIQSVHAVGSPDRREMSTTSPSSGAIGTVVPGIRIREEKRRAEKSPQPTMRCFMTLQRRTITS